MTPGTAAGDTPATGDPGSLQNLNDIVMPAAVPWWPPAPGWYLLAAVGLLVLAWLGFRAFRNWRLNRYRRAALAELQGIRGGGGRAVELPELLKRTALSAWPRTEVASLYGEAWHRFLDDSAGTDRFCTGQGNVLEQLAYAAGGEPELSPSQLNDVFDAAEFWLKHHRVEAA